MLQGAFILHVFDFISDVHATYYKDPWAHVSLAPLSGI